jgi:hypothetical protein
MAFKKKKKNWKFSNLLKSKLEKNKQKKLNKKKINMQHYYFFFHFLSELIKKTLSLKKKLFVFY